MLKHFNVFSLFKANYIKLNDVFMLKNNNYILMTGKKKIPFNRFELFDKKKNYFMNFDKRKGSIRILCDS